MLLAIGLGSIPSAAIISTNYFLDAILSGVLYDLFKRLVKTRRTGFMKVLFFLGGWSGGMV